MNIKQFNNLTLIPLLLFAGCRRDHSPHPLDFRVYEKNPILIADEKSWDNLALVTPHAVLYDSVFYLFFTGFAKDGSMAIGLATSADGFSFRKYPENPLVFPDKKGYDVFGVGSPAVIHVDTAWLMYFNASEIGYYGPGPAVESAIAEDPAGPWTKSEEPVLSTGSKGEWDAGYIFPTSVIRDAEGKLMMYYTAGNEKFPAGVSQIGVAFSQDGIHWKKFDDPATSRHPFSESDPILKTGEKLAWEKDGLWSCHVFRTDEGFGMYYGGQRIFMDSDCIEFGYAMSIDGIHWVKHKKNPVFSFYCKTRDKIFCEFPSVCFTDSMAFLYYDNGSIAGEIGVATAKIAN